MQISQSVQGGKSAIPVQSVSIELTLLLFLVI